MALGCVMMLARTSAPYTGGHVAAITVTTTPPAPWAPGRPSEKALSTLWRRSPSLPDGLTTQDGRRLRVLYAGRSNPREGPDFLDARLAAESGEVISRRRRASRQGAGLVRPRPSPGPELQRRHPSRRAHPQRPARYAAAVGRRRARGIPRAARRRARTRGPGGRAVRRAVCRYSTTTRWPRRWTRPETRGSRRGPRG